MKKVSMMIMAIMIASSAAVARRLAPEMAANATVVKSGSTFTVSYVRGEAKNVKVTIFNADNERLYTETIHKIANFTRPYNFSDLPEGEYTIEINDGNSKIVKEVVYERENKDSEQLVKWSPVWGTDDKYVLSVANQGQAIITIKIFEANGNLAYTKTESIDGNFAKVYNLRKLKGNVLVEVADAKGNIKSINL